MQTSMAAAGRIRVAENVSPRLILHLLYVEQRETEARG